jgi:hypothetical protein
MRLIVPAVIQAYITLNSSFDADPAFSDQGHIDPTASRRARFLRDEAR